MFLLFIKSDKHFHTLDPESHSFSVSFFFFLGWWWLWHVMEESGSGESPCLQSPWSMVEEENNVLGWRWGDIWEGYIWGIWGIYGIYGYMCTQG